MGWKWAGDIYGLHIQFLLQTLKIKHFCCFCGQNNVFAWHSSVFVDLLLIQIISLGSSTKDQDPQNIFRGILQVDNSEVLEDVTAAPTLRLRLVLFFRPVPLRYRFKNIPRWPNLDNVPGPV